MTSVDKQKHWKHFLQLCRAAQSDAELDELFHFLFTQEEREYFAMRVVLTKYLLEGDKPQRDIARELGTGIATITRGSNMLKTIKPKFRAFLSKYLL